MAPVRSLLGARFRTAMRGVLALLCLVPQGGLALAAAPPAYGPQGLPREERALTACTPTGSFTNCTRVTYSGGDQTFTVPAGVTAVYARVFGAGGAGSPRAYYTGQYGGGGGGYTTGTLAVTPGQALTLTVGQGGRMNSTTSSYGGGGAGGQGYTAANGSSATGGSGGGMSAVWNGASGTNPLVVAGGGGGSSPGADATTPAAGGGGGSNGGQDNQPAASGRGGTQSAGGAAATQTACAAPTAGAQYQGGRGASSPQNEGGGGGGGGYYGGGGGACQRGGTLDANGMGGGGSGYNRGTGVTNTQTSNGTNSSGNGVGGTSGGRSDAQYTSGSGIGDGGGYTDGGNGEIVLEWVTQVGLSVRKTASPTTYVPGQRLTYTFVVSNAGPAPAVNAAVRDALPSALSGFTWTCASGGTGSSCGAASGTGNLDTTATIAAGSSVTYTVTGTVPSSTTGTLSNTATVTRPAASTDPNCGPTCSSTVDTPGRVTTGLSVTKTPDKNPYVPGQPLTYTIVVKNDGPSDAVGTSVRDTLPTTIRNFTWTCTAAGGGSCGTPASGTGDINTTVDLPAGGQVTYRLTGTVPADATGSLDNRATVTPPGGTTDPNCSPSCTSTANPVPPGNQANLVVSKTLLTSPVVPGQQVKWQVKVTNNGPSRARNVVVTDQVPAGVTAASMANDQDGTACPISGGTATCPAVEIPVNGTASWTLTGTLDPNATATPTNTALVTGGPDPSASTRTAVASPTAGPSPQANLTISKTLLTNPVVPGAQIQWRVTVTNNGPSRARNVVVTDQVPAGVTGASMRQGADGPDCPISGGTATCPAVEIAAGSSQTWTLTGTLDPNATVTPTNTAVVTGGPDPGATARTAVASPTASPSPQANLTVSKSLLTSPVVPGQPVQWRVTVTNNGPSRARNVVVTDQVPAGVSGASMTADTGGANCPISGGVATCPAVEIPAGSSLSWTLTGTLDSNATTTPTNSVTVTGGPDPAASSRTAVATPSGSPSPQANLKVSKSLVTNPVVPGQRIEWRVNIFNAGPSRARNVVVTDTVPAGVNNPVMTAPDGSTCPISGGTATCPAVEIPAGQALNWTLTGTLDPNATTTPTNTVTVTGGPDPTASTHTAVASPTAGPSPQANLTVSKSLLTNPVVPGQQIQWRVTVTNNGPSRARDVVVRDQIPAGVSGAVMTASDGTGCPIGGGVATCPAVEIPAGSSQTWTLTGTLDANATVTPTNTVTVTGGPDPATPTHTAVASPSGSPSPQANLTVSKVLLTDPVVPGRQIQWQVTVTNNGPSRARNVVVTDQVPAGVNNPVMTASDGTGCPISGGVATCPAVEIPAGSSQTWTLTGTLASDATATPTNTVTVTGGPDPSASTRTAVASPTAGPSPQANLTVSKSLLTNPVVPGQRIEWRVTVTNNGPSRARDVVVRDQIPAGVSGASMTADTGGANCPISGGVATCPAVEIPAGSSLSWTLTGTLDSNATSTPTNTATVTGGPDPATPTHTAVASPTAGPSPQANLTVSKVLLTNPVVPGQQIQWRVTVTNNGPSRARNVVVTDQVPTGITGATMTADTGGANCPISSGVATCPAVEIPAGQTLTWTLTGTLDANATTTPTNTATVTGGPDPATPTHTAVASPTAGPSPQANLTVSKVLLTNPVVPGQQIQWRVSVTNNGPSRARNVVVTDQVPAGVSNASMAAADGTPCPIGGGTATCPAVEIPAGQTLTWTLTGTLDANATTTPLNTATVTGGPDPATPTHTAVASPTKTPSPQANLTVSKALLTNPVVPGQQIQWRVSVTNNGPSRARNVVVTDTVPAGVTGASMKADADNTPCPINTGKATCPAVEIPVGQTLTWTLTGTLAQDATVTPTNTATVTGGPDPSVPTHTAVASPTNSPSPQASLTVSKVLLTNPVVPGQQIQWRVSVTNNGPSRARDVMVTDQVPAGVNNATMSADANGANCPISNGLATCPAVEIPVGQTLTWTLTGTLAQDATVTPTNTATVTGGPDPATPTHTAVASPTNTPAPQANLTTSKVLLTNPVVPGQQIQWRVSVTNNGPSRARDVVVTDTVPAGVTGASMKADADGTNCPINSGTATCPAVEIPVSQTLTWTLTGTLDANATVTPTNTATVTGGPDPATPTHTAIASPTNTPSSQANLTVSKALLTNSVIPGQQIQWRVSVTNNGPSRARNVVVTDTVPAGVTGASMKADADGTNCPINSGTATCPAVEIPVGQTLTWTLTGTLAQDATVTPTNTATVTGGPDPATPTHTAVASPTNSPTPQANLTVSKALLTDPVVPGQQIQWRVTVTNIGPSRARDVVVTDTVPAGVNNPAMTAADGTNCPINGGTATCPAVEIPAGSSVTWTLTGTLDANATVTPTNTVTVTGGPDPATPTHTAIASPSNTPSTQANLTVSKALLTNPVVPGQQIQWRVTVTNNGPSRARNVVVTDTVPAGVNNASMAAGDGTNCPISNGTATCPAVEIPAGSSMTWTLTGTLDANATVTPTNTVTVTGGPDPATPTHTAVASPTNTPSTQANLTVSKALLTNPVVPGQQIQWQVSVTNNGPSRARDVVVTDTIPAGVTGASMKADADGTNCPINSGTATCPAVEIPVSQTLTWTLTGTLDANATVTPTNTATVTGGPDPATPTHTAIASPTNTPSTQANLTASKALLTNPVVPGQQIQWQVSVTNNGPSQARDVVVTDTIPAGVTGASMKADADNTPCPISNGTATCPAVEIPVGQTLTWTLTGTLAQDATVTPTNTATVTGGPDPATPTHTAVASPTNLPTPQANLTASKALLTNPVVPGQQIQWQVSVTNNGPSRARDVVVTDTVPAGVNNPAMTAADGTNCPINGGTATCPAVEIPVGQTLTWTLTGTLAQDATVTPTNTATVTGGPDPATPTHTAIASPTNTPSTQANLTASKALLTNPVIPGQQIQWQVSVTNNGPSQARDVVVTDTVPAGVNNPAMTAADGTNCPING
ncbi:glycine-rich protein, partial [Kitasatospora purpeofusca]|uniref:glycine-rich protein n=2 Tax=Kitasatospora purpeofusca TaxID=67352 RepID=UPI0035DE1D24